MMVREIISSGGDPSALLRAPTRPHHGMLQVVGERIARVLFRVSPEEGAAAWATALAEYDEAWRLEAARGIAAWRAAHPAKQEGEG